MFVLQSHKDANEKLCMWGRYVCDGWLRDHLMYSPPPTSEHYRAPIVGWDEPEPADTIDELDALETEAIVIRIGVTPGCFDLYRVLVYYYPHLLAARREMPQAECVKRLAKHLHTGFPAAERMLYDAVARFAEIRFTSL